MGWIVTLLGLLALSFNRMYCGGGTINIPDLPKENYHRVGDFNIGVVIPIHLGESGSFCGPELRGLPLLQRLEAIVYAVEEINNDSTILPNHTLGFVIFDDCYTDLTALAQSLHFSRIQPLHYAADGESMTSQCLVTGTMTPVVCVHDVIAVIGSESSITTVQIANLMTTFQIPQVSYLATAHSLSNKAKYPYFHRVVPSDNTQARVIIELMIKFNWTFIYVMYSEGAYGEGLYQELENILKEESYGRSICFAEPIIIRQNFQPRDFDSVIYNMLIQKAANVTLIITPEHEARKILTAAKRMVVQDRFTWIATDAWARDLPSLRGVTEEALGTISINIHSTPVSRFNQYFHGITGATQLLNPWVASYWKYYFNCTQTDDTKTNECADIHRFVDLLAYHPDGVSSLVFDAVRSLAYTIDQRVRKDCSGLTGSSLVNCVNTDFHHSLRNIRFRGETGDEVSFDSNGDRMTTFDIFNIQRGAGDDEYKMVSVGEWNPNSRKLNLEAEKIQWAGGKPPMSNCSRPCGVGEGMELQQKRCCWNCVACASNQYTRSTYLGIVRCFTCPDGKWPDKATRTMCVDITPRYLTWHDEIGLTLGALASVGVSMCIVVTVIFVLNNSHQLIKACSRELSYYMLFGIVCSYCFVFSFILKPTDAVCFVNELGVIISFTITYAPLTTKTIRIYRIFESGRKMNRKPRCVSWSSQLIICVTATVLHAAVVVVWSRFDAPEPNRIKTSPGEFDLICRFPTAPFLTSMALNLLLLVICSFFAYKTRKLPDNFNESRFVAFCVYSTVVLWLAFIPGYVLTESVQRALFIGLMLITNSFVLLGGLFFPKIYAVYFVEKAGLHIKVNCGLINAGERSAVHHIGHFIQDVQGVAAVGARENSRVSVSQNEPNIAQASLPDISHVRDPDSGRSPGSSEQKEDNSTVKETKDRMDQGKGPFGKKAVVSRFARNKVTPVTNTK